MSYNSYNSEVMDANEMTAMLVEQSDMLKSLGSLMMKHTASIFLSSLSEEQNKRIQEALVDKIVEGIKNNSFRSEFAGALTRYLEEMFVSAPNSMKGPIIKEAMKSVETELDELVDWQFKNKAKEVGKTVLDNWIEGNESIIEAKATEIIKTKLESVFNTELATHLLKDLSKKVIENKFKHILD